MNKLFIIGLVFIILASLTSASLQGEQYDILLFENDAVGEIKGFTPAVTGDPTYNLIYGVNNKGVQLDSNDYFKIPSSGIEWNFTNDWTFNYWTKRGGTGGDNIHFDLWDGTTSSNRIQIKYQTDNTMKILIYAPNGIDKKKYISNNVISGTTTHMVTIKYDGTDLKAYINSTELIFTKDNDDAVNRAVDTLNLHLGGSNGTSFYNGEFDEFYIWEKSLNQTDITDLWNGGTGSFYPFTTTPTETGLNLEVGTIINPSGSNARYILGNNFTGLEEVVVNSTAIRIETNRNYTFSNSPAVPTDYTIYQKIINFTGYDGFNNSLVTNYSIEIFGYNYTTSSSEIDTSIIYITPPSTFDIFDAVNSERPYINFTDSIDFSTFDNDYNITMRPYTNISVYYNFGGAKISNLNITYASTSDPTNITEITITGEVGFLPLYNDTYEVTVKGGGVYNTLASNLTASPYLHEANFTLYDSNSVNIKIYNYHNQSLINQSVEIKVISDTISYINNTNTGEIWLNFLINEDYEIRFTSDGFVNSSKFITVLEDSTQNITIYLQESANTEIQTIQVIDTSGQPVEGAIVWAKREYIGGVQEFQEIQEVQTNSEGKTAIYVERDTTVFYTFSIIYNGVARPIEPSGETTTTKTFFIPDIIETIEFIINLEVSQIEGALLDQYAPLTDVDVNNNTVNYTFIDGRNTITGGRLLIYGKYLENSSSYVLLSNQTDLGSEGEITYTFPIKNNTIYKIEAYLIKNSQDTLVFSTLKRFDANVLVSKETGLLMAVMVLLAVALLTVTMGTLASLLFTFASLIPLTILNILDIPIAVITSLLALVIILFVRLRRK